MSQDQLPIVFSVLQWHVVDGTIDNTVSIAAVDGEEQTVETGTRVRQAGWDAAARFDGPKTLGWPPNDHELIVALNRSDWEFVLTELRRWDDVDSGIGEPVDRSLDVQAVITTALGN